MAQGKQQRKFERNPHIMNRGNCDHVTKSSRAKMERSKGKIQKGRERKRQRENKGKITEEKQRKQKTKSRIK